MRKPAGGLSQSLWDVRKVGYSGARLGDEKERGCLVESLRSVMGEQSMESEVYASRHKVTAYQNNSNAEKDREVVERRLS